MSGALRGLVRRGFDWCRDLQHRYAAAHGQVLAAGITLYSFLALFALLVLTVAVLGFISAGDADVTRRIVHNLGVSGHAAHIVIDGVNAARRSRRLTTVAGLVGIVWLGTSWAASIANAYDAAWRVPGRGVRDRVVGLVWLLGAAVLVAAAAGATAGLGLLPALLAPLVVIVSLAVDTALWLWTSWLLPNRHAPWRTLLAPAFAGALALEVLKVIGGYVVPRYVASSSELYGAIGTVFALLLWLLVFGRLVVYVAVLEAKRAGVVRAPAAP